MIRGVEAVEIAGLAGAFAHGAESEFALASDFTEDVRGLVHLQTPDFEGSAAGESAFRWKRGDFGGELRGRGRGCDGTLRLQAEGGQTPLRTHGLTTCAEIGGGGVAATFDPVGRGGVADADLHRVVAAAQKLAREHGGAKGRMGEAGDVEGRRVAAINPHGDHFGAGAAGEAHRVLIPFFFRNAEAAPLPVGDDAGGENNEKPAAIEPLQTVAQAAGVGAAGGSGVGEIDGEAQLADAIDFEHLLVGEVANIFAAAEEEVGGDDGVSQSETMVGDDDRGAICGNVPEFVVGGINRQSKPLLEARAEFAGAGASGQFTGEGAKFVDGKELFSPGGEGHRHWYSSGM